MTMWLTSEEAAARIRVSPEFVQRQCAAGEIKAKKVGHEWRISEAALEAFMSSDGPTTPLQVLTARQKRKSA
jgi:excisionase family DNA binding protein